MFPLTVTTVQDEKDLANLMRFMEKQPQFYSGYLDWLFGKCKTRIEASTYIPIIAITEGKVIGTAVYHLVNPNNVAIKNFRIDPKYQNRDLGHFLLKQVEAETQRATMTLDVSVANFEGVEFFIHNGFKITGKEHLYSPDQDEYLMRRDLRKAS
jgi:ribosomal protein S18 acetylase RimI-like enzyme